MLSLLKSIFTLIIFAVLSYGASASLVAAPVVLYTKQSSFTAASINIQTFDFEGVAPSKSFGLNNQLTLSGATFAANNGLFVVGPDYYPLYNYATAAAGQFNRWESWEGTDYDDISIRWRHLSYGGWECQFKNDTTSRVQINYTVEYMDGKGESGHKKSFSIMNARSTGEGSYVMNALYKPRINYSGISAPR
ncbi:MAG: hypothetical protein WKF30_02660 [Pyrinomonadaceae bacterium]